MPLRLAATLATLMLASTASLSACTATPQPIEAVDMSPVTQSFQSFDGTAISYTQLGEGPVVLLLHGFTVNAKINWFDTGIAQQIASAGYTVIAPDTRGHGKSPAQTGPKAWPNDAAARDQIALMKNLDAEPYAIVGYSMGSLVAMRYHLLSRQGSKLVLGGVGNSAADENNTDRNTAFRAAIEAAIAGADTQAAKSMRLRAKATGAKLEDYLGALSSRTYTGADLLQTFDIPTLVLTGDEDLDNGSGPALAKIIPNAEYQQLTGTHTAAVGDPALPAAIIAFLEKE